MEHLNNKDDSQSDSNGMGEIISTLTSSPVSEFLRSVKEFLDGTVNAELFKQELTSERERFSGIYEKFIHIYTGGDIAALIKEEMDRVYSSFWYYGKTLEEMESYFENYDLQIIKSGLAILQNCVLAANESFKIFLTIQSSENNKKCLYCQSSNLFGALSCQTCGAIFSLSPEEIYQEFASLLKKCKTLPQSSRAYTLAGSLVESYFSFVKFSSGEFPKEKYIEYIDWLTNQCDTTRRRLEREQYGKPPEQLRFEDLREVELLFDALDSSIKTLDRLHDGIILDACIDFTKEWNDLIRAIYLILQSNIPIGDKADDNRVM